MTKVLFSIPVKNVKRISFHDNCKVLFSFLTMFLLFGGWIHLRPTQPFLFAHLQPFPCSPLGCYVNLFYKKVISILNKLSKVSKRHWFRQKRVWNRNIWKGLTPNPWASALGLIMSPKFVKALFCFVICGFLSTQSQKPTW